MARSSWMANAQTSGEDVVKLGTVRIVVYALSSETECKHGAWIEREKESRWEQERERGAGERREATDCQRVESRSASRVVKSNRVELSRVESGRDVEGNENCQRAFNWNRVNYVISQKFLRIIWRFYTFWLTLQSYSRTSAFPPVFVPTTQANP